MDKRMIDFIAGLRASGVRISIAESGDAFEAIRQMGIQDREIFRNSLRTTLIKEATHLPIFDQLFPLFFSDGGPPLLNALDDLTPEQRQQLAAALRQLLEQLRQNQQNQQNQQGDPQQDQSGWPQSMPDSQLAALLNLLHALLTGQNPGREQLDRMGEQAGLNQARHPYQQRWMEQRIQRQMGMDKLDELLEQLWEMLAQAGMSQETIDQLKDMVEGNREALAEQISQFVGSSMAEQAAQEKRPPLDDSLMERPFQSLSDREREMLREQMRRLAAQLRSRAALRQKRGKVGVLDVKRTIRSNMRYGSVPFELQFKSKHLKPKLVLICDVSTSMRSVVEFMLGMIYELQDQVAKARSFAFIDHIEEISDDFATHPAHEAMDIVLERMPPGHYNTDLGYSLDRFLQEYGDSVDHRTTVIFIGDARNNFNDPRLDCMDQLKRRCKQIIWLTPEGTHLWGSGDSDMPEYVPFCAAIHRVSNMVELAAAVDRLLGS